MSKSGHELPPERIAERDAQRARELQAIVSRLTGEQAEAQARLVQTEDQAERAALETEIVHLALALAELRRGPGSADEFSPSRPARAQTLGAGSEGG